MSASTHSRRSRPTAQDLIRESRVVVWPGMTVASAMQRLAEAGASVAAVVNGSGRCVGLFAADGSQQPRDEVRLHMARQFGVVIPDAGMDEVRHRLAAAADPYLVVLDRQMRPIGVVRATDVPAAEEGTSPSCGERDRVPQLVG